jgi:2-amino-4-hydroxy-6-hydroxymethyldihydropteridine diphosphokinase
MSPSSSSGKADGAAAVAAVISLGSNIGERERNVLTAASRIASSEGIVSARLSSLYETEPEGKAYSGSFINAVMIVQTHLGPRSLLELGLRLESEGGRTRGMERGDRTIDIDLIICGDSEISEDGLTLPHPRFMKRLFVLLPLAELDGEFPLPGGMSAGRAAAGEEAAGKVARISSRRRIRRKSL